MSSSSFKSRKIFGSIFVVFCIAGAGIIIYIICNREKEKETPKGKENAESKGAKKPINAQKVKQTNKQSKQQSNEDEIVQQDELHKKKDLKSPNLYEEMQKKEKELQEMIDRLNKNKNHPSDIDKNIFKLPTVRTKIKEIKTFDNFLDNEYQKKDSNKNFMYYLKISAQYEIFYYKINKNRTVIFGSLSRKPPKHERKNEDFKKYIDENISKAFSVPLDTYHKNKKHDMRNGILCYWDIDSFTSIIDILDKLIMKMENKEIKHSEISLIYTRYLKDTLFHLSNLSDEELQTKSLYCEVMVFNLNDVKDEENIHTIIRFESDLSF